MINNTYQIFVLSLVLLNLVSGGWKEFSGGAIFCGPASTSGHKKFTRRWGADIRANIKQQLIAGVGPQIENQIQAQMGRQIGDSIGGQDTNSFCEGGEDDYSDQYGVG